MISYKLYIQIYADTAHQFTMPAHRADQAAFAHTVKAPAPSLSLGGGLIYSPRCCTWDQIDHSLASHRGARWRVCVCVCKGECGSVMYM
jgi:hypothetical protein